MKNKNEFFLAQMASKSLLGCHQYLKYVSEYMSTNGKDKKGRGLSELKL